MAITILHKRGVDANRPALSDGEFYIATDTKTIYHSSGAIPIPVISAEVHLTAQGAAISTTTLLTPAASGMFRLNVYSKVTRAATTSSTLGAVTIGFTDATDSVAQTLVLALMNQAGTMATTNTGNATSSKLCGSTVIWAKAAVAITYAVAYVSSGTTTMQYEFHIEAEPL